jgi:hypothetical protein
MTEIALRDTDSGYGRLTDIAALAETIARTEFVPDALRGKPAAVAACIMFGREIGLPPMTSLQNIAVIHGTPTLGARMMRALVQAAGHEIQVTETTNTRCKVRGVRVDTGQALEVGWTLDDAKQAGLVKSSSGWSRYPRNMLQSRATSELCRLLFADVVAGFVTPEEAGDDTTVDDSGATVVAATASGDTPAIAVASPVAKPKRRRKAAAAALPAALPAATPDAPPLPGEEGYDTVGRAAADLVAQSPDDTEPTVAQIKALYTAMSAAGLGTREDKLRFCSDVTGRTITSSKGLTREEVSTCLDTLKSLDPAEERPGADIVDPETGEIAT